VRQPFRLRVLGSVPASAVAAAAREKAAASDRFGLDLIACHLTIERADGRGYTVNIRATLTDGEFGVDGVRHDDVAVALHEAFGALQRRIDDAIHHAGDGVPVLVTGAPVRR